MLCSGGAAPFLSLWWELRLFGETGSSQLGCAHEHPRTPVQAQAASTKPDSVCLPHKHVACLPFAHPHTSLIFFRVFFSCLARLVGFKRHGNVRIFFRLSTANGSPFCQKMQKPRGGAGPSDTDKKQKKCGQQTANFRKHQQILGVVLVTPVLPTEPARCTTLCKW